MVSNISDILDGIISCCFGKKKKFVEEIKDDIKGLSEQALNHIRAFLIRPIKDKCYCC